MLDLITAISQHKKKVLGRAFWRTRTTAKAALPHQKSSPAVCSTGGGQELLAGFSADETGGGDGPWITSAPTLLQRGVLAT
jgi:hypothetical protein